MKDKINAMKEMIVDRIYSSLTSGREMSTETFIGLSNIIIAMDKTPKETSDEECMQSTTETI